MNTNSGVIVVTLKDHTGITLDHTAVVLLEHDDTLNHEQQERVTIGHCQGAGMALLTEYANSFKREEDKRYYMSVVEFDNFANSTDAELKHLIDKLDKPVEFEYSAIEACGLRHPVKICYKHVKVFNQ